MASITQSAGNSELKDIVHFPESLGKILKQQVAVTMTEIYIV